MFERAVQRLDFVGRWKIWFAISGILLLAGLVSIGMGRLNLGIDFEGGAKFTVSGATHRLSTGEIRNQVLPNYAARGAVIQPAGKNGYQIQTPVLSQKQIQQVKNDIKQKLGGEVSVTSVSPTFGGQVQTQALQAMGAAFLIIILFISFRFEFAFALAAILALFHDLLMTVGFYAIVGREVSLITVVAVLTILGYSLYDTIIIFDRIRENAPTVGYNRRRFDQTINTSIRQVIRRSIYTSLSTVIPVAALLIFGESTLSDFAFALLVGIISGTYSSIFIASPTLSLYKAWRGGKLRQAASSS